MFSTFWYLKFSNRIYMRFAILSITFLILFPLHRAFGQSDISKFLSDSLSEKISNEDVLEAKTWYDQGLIEKSLKKGLEIISSNSELTQIDSFYTFQILAFNFKAIQAYRPALEYAEKAVEVMYRIKPDDNSIITWIAPYYSAVKNYDTAIVYMKMDIRRFMQESDTLNLLKSYNDVGFTYSLNMETDSAIAYYNRVIGFGVTGKKYEGILGLSTGNLGVIYLKRGDYKEALALIKLDAKLNKDHDIDSYYNAMNAIGECYFMMREYALAKTTLLKLTTLNPNQPKTKIKTYDLLAKAYEATSNPQKSLFYMKKQLALEEDLKKDETQIESVMTQLTASKVYGFKKDLEISKGKVDLMNSELMLAQNKIKAQTLITQIYLILAVLSIVVVLIIVIGYRYRQRKNKKIHQLETELISAELHTKKQDLTNVVTNLSYMREFIDTTQNKLKDLGKEADGKTKEKVSALIREVGSYQNTDKTIAVLQSDIDNVNLAFFKKLDEKFPTLTQNEKELCGLLFLKLSSKDIAVLRNISPNAVKKARQRIRRKLPIDKDQKIASFLQSI